MKNIAIGVFMLFVLATCKKEDQLSVTASQKEDLVISEYLKENKLDAQRTANGIYYYFDKKNTNLQTKLGDSVLVHYTGNLIYGKTFDSSRFTNQPFGMRIGVSKLITGWHEALLLMRKGERATFFIPSILGYGVQGQQPDIPSSAILVFDIEIIEHFPQ